MTDTAWMNLPLDQTTIKKSMVTKLKAHLGADATLGHVAQMRMSELKAIKGAGKVAVQSCMDALKYAVHGAPPPSGPTLLEVISSENPAPVAEEQIAA